MWTSTWASQPTRGEDRGYSRMLTYYNRLTMHYSMYNNILMYLNILLLDKSITFLITYHTLSMELSFIIRLEIFMWQEITIAQCKDYVRVTERMDISSKHQITFCIVYMHLQQYVCFVCDLLSLNALHACIVLYVVKCNFLQYSM